MCVFSVPCLEYYRKVTTFVFTRVHYIELSRYFSSYVDNGDPYPRPADPMTSALGLLLNKRYNRKK